MKINFKTFLPFCLGFTLLSCGPTSNDAVKYNDTITGYQSKLFEKETILSDAISKNMKEKLDSAYIILQKQLNEADENTKKIKAFDGKTDLKDAAIKVVEAYQDVMKNEYCEIIKMSKLPDSCYTQDTDDKIINLSNIINKKIDNAVDAFNKKQYEFAEKYKFELSNQDAEKK